jgi:hypothetical protein
MISSSNTGFAFLAASQKPCFAQSSKRHRIGVNRAEITIEYTNLHVINRDSLPIHLLSSIAQILSE